MLEQFLNGISSGAVTPQTNYTDIIQQLEQALITDVKRTQLLMQQGVISQEKGQYLIAGLVDKFKEIDLCKKVIPVFSSSGIETEQAVSANTENPLDVFTKENPDFFTTGGRGDVLEYLKGLNVDKDEISKIAQIVEKLEQSAVDGYLKKSAHDKTLNDENEIAKSKLNSYAQNATSDNKTGKVFTRAEIGAMSGEEFARNEKQIMEQVRQGLIK